MALSPAIISLIVIGVVFLLVAIGLIIYAFIYFRRKQQEQEAKTNDYFVGKSLEEPVVTVANIQNGFHHHTLSNGATKPTTNGHMTSHVTGTYNTDRKKHPVVSSSGQNIKTTHRNQPTSLSIPVFPAKKQRRDEVDHGRVVVQNGRGHNTRGPVYVYQAPNRGQHLQQPVYIVSRQGAGNKMHMKQTHYRTQQTSHTQKLDKNWNLKPIAQEPYHHPQQQQRQRLVTLDKYRPLEIEQTPELDRRGVATDRSPADCRSVDDIDGRALYLRWSPSVARRKRESANTRQRDDFRDEDVDFRWEDDFRRDGERPPSGGSYKIATNTLPMPRGNKAGLPSPIPASNQYPHKTQM